MLYYVAIFITFFRPPKRYKLIPHHRPVLLGHAHVVGRAPIPKKRYNYHQGTRRGPLSTGLSGTRRGPLPTGPSSTRRGPFPSGQNVYQGRLNSQQVVSQLRKDRPRGGNRINPENMTNPNNHGIRLSGTGSRRRPFGGERRKKNKGIRNNKRQNGSGNNNIVHPLESYRRRKQKKKLQGKIYIVMIYFCYYKLLVIKMLNVQKFNARLCNKRLILQIK